jgi:hypothetical protein
VAAPCGDYFAETETEDELLLAAPDRPPTLTEKLVALAEFGVADTLSPPNEPLQDAEALFFPLDVVWLSPPAVAAPAPSTTTAAAMMILIMVVLLLRLQHGLGAAAPEACR